MTTKSKQPKKTATKNVKAASRAMRKALDAVAKADGKVLPTGSCCNTNVRPASPDEIPEFLKNQNKDCHFSTNTVTGNILGDLLQFKKRQEQGQFFGFLLDNINIVVMGHMLTYIAIALNFAAKYQPGVAFGVIGLAVAYFAVISRRASSNSFSGFLVLVSQAAVIASYAGWAMATIFAN